jgi:transcriptional regulator with XRE-family HTH domain
MAIRTRIFRIAEDRRWTIKRLSLAMGLTTGALYQVQRGDRGIGAKFIRAASQAFPEYRLDDLFYDEEGGFQRPICW